MVIILNENEILKKREMLYDYLSFNFIPLISKPVKRNWVKWFSKYWKGDITYKELVKMCPITEEELLHKFDVFIKEEDLE
jgi:hypothetical protein